MQVFARWNKAAAPIAFVPAAYRDRDAMFRGDAGYALGLMLGGWALSGQGFCFNAANGVLFIGLVKVGKRAKARSRRRRRARR